MKTFLPVALIIISVGIFFVGIRPQYDVVRTLIQERSEYRDALSNTEKVILRRDELEAELAAIPESDLARLNQMIPSPLNIVKLVADIDAMGGQHGITIENVKVSNAPVVEGPGMVAAKPYDTTSINFSVKARYRNFVDFIRTLERNSQLIDVRNVTFVAESPTGVYEYDVAVDTYSVK